MAENLFDLSGRKENNPEKNRRETNRPNLPDDVFDKLQTMIKQHSNIEIQLEEAFQKAGIDPKELSKFCENPDNFTPSQWERYQKNKEQIELAVTGLSKENLSINKQNKANVKVAKERRGKTLGSRKNWLNMH